MEVYNEQMERIENPDLSRGYLRDGMRRVFHAAVKGVKEVWHYETVRAYANGGRDVQKVIDVPGAADKAAWTQEIPVHIYVPYTQEELEEMEAQKSRPTIEERIERLEKAGESTAELIAGILRRIEERESRERGESIGKNDGEIDQLALDDEKPVSQ